MNSLAITVVCLLGFALNCSAQIGGCNPSELRAHATDCLQFMMCTGSSWEPMQCPPGTVFNPPKNVCDFRMNVPQCQQQKMCGQKYQVCGAGLECTDDTDPNTKGYSCRTRKPGENPCASNPCLNGMRCQNYIVARNGYICVGNNGGVLPADACRSNPCFNNGSCKLSSFTGLGYLCSCPQGYFGPRCENRQ